MIGLGPNLFLSDEQYIRDFLSYSLVINTNTCRILSA